MIKSKRIIRLFEQLDLENEFVIAIKQVDGAKTRDEISLDFVEGGNFMVYDFIPEGEIWIEKTMEKEDKIGTLIHEWVEILLMKYYGVFYDEAHDVANSTEQAVRDFIRANGLAGQEKENE